MKKLLAAFTIFAKYSNDEFPTSCEHDVMYVHVNPLRVSDEDKKELRKLGFIADEENLYNFYSHKYGSC